MRPRAVDVAKLQPGPDVGFERLRFSKVVENLVGGIDTKAFCILPWIHMNLNPDGVDTLCRQSHEPIYDDKGCQLNAQTHSLADIWNSAGTRDIRKRMSAGEKLPHCNSCFGNEGFGR
jgi:hypothetical protein